jgi:hypothetical protein
MSLSRQLFSLAVSFAYLSYWHGANSSVTIWSSCNFMMVLIELLFFNFIAKNKEVLNLVSILVLTTFFINK